MISAVPGRKIADRRDEAQNAPKKTRRSQTSDPVRVRDDSVPKARGQCRNVPMESQTVERTGEFASLVRETKTRSVHKWKYGNLPEESVPHCSRALAMIVIPTGTDAPIYHWPYVTVGLDRSERCALVYRSARLERGPTR